MAKKKFKCFACPRTVEQIGEAEVEQGWGKFQGRAGIGMASKAICIVHCPDHVDGYIAKVQKEMEKLRRKA